MPNTALRSPMPGRPGRAGVWLRGLFVTLWLGWMLIGGPAAGAALPPDVIEIESALASASPQASTLDDRQPTIVDLPALAAGLPLQSDASIRLSVRFDRPRGVEASTLLAAHFAGSCGAMDLELNGEAIHEDGDGQVPTTAICPRPRLFALPAAALYERGNRLDIVLRGMAWQQTTNIRRAAYLSTLWIGPQPTLQRVQAAAELRQLSLPRLVHFVLLMIGGLMLLMSRAHPDAREMRLYGLTALLWSAGIGQLFAPYLALPAPWFNLLMASLWTPSLALASEFLLGLCGFRLRWLRIMLLIECLLLPLSLLLAPPDGRFALAALWQSLLLLQGLAVLGFYLYCCWHKRHEEFWFSLATLALGALAWALDSLATPAQLPSWAGAAWIAGSPYGWATLLIAVGVRMLSAYSHSLAATEASRAALQTRVHDVTAMIERNFAQLAEMRVEQMTEQERRRIASDLHDDLGAKLLTIVHTCDSERIATLGREALDDMRLSVRGLSGKPMQLAHALADWRAETVLRLGQTHIEVEWTSPGDHGEQLLQARAFVQTTRILREAVSNIIKHSGATRCRVTCFAAFGAFGIIIEDNGRGLPVADDQTINAGHGLSSMKHRAAQMNGRCKVESEVGVGTVIHLTLPL